MEIPNEIVFEKVVEVKQDPIVKIIDIWREKVIEVYDEIYVPVTNDIISTETIEKKIIYNTIVKKEVRVPVERIEYIDKDVGVQRIVEVEKKVIKDKIV